jgi:hypothetical protein
MDAQHPNSTVAPEAGSLERFLKSGIDNYLYTVSPVPFTTNILLAVKNMTGKRHMLNKTIYAGLTTATYRLELRSLAGYQGKSRCRILPYDCSKENNLEPKRSFDSLFWREDCL